MCIICTSMYISTAECHKSQRPIVTSKWNIWVAGNRMQKLHLFNDCSKPTNINQHAFSYSFSSNSLSHQVPPAQPSPHPPHHVQFPERCGSVGSSAAAKPCLRGRTGSQHTPGIRQLNNSNDEKILTLSNQNFIFQNSAGGGSGSGGTRFSELLPSQELHIRFALISTLGCSVS